MLKVIRPKNKLTTGLKVVERLPNNHTKSIFICLDDNISLLNTFLFDHLTQIFLDFSLLWLLLLLVVAVVVEVVVVVVVV